MRELVEIFLSTWILGPVGGTACASLRGFGAGQIFLLVTLSNALIALLWLAVAELLSRRLALFSLLRGRGKGKLTLVGLGLLAFSLGSMVALMTAYALGVGRRAFPLIASCAVGSGALWTLGSLGLLVFLPPLWLYLGALAVTLLLLSGRLYSRRELLRQTFRAWRRDTLPGAATRTVRESSRR
jgi:hypothetical protein